MMQEKILFKSSSGEPVSNLDILGKLKAVGAHRCDVLYVHTALTFGLPLLKKSELLDELFQVFKALEVGTLIFPTYTFSFPNGEDFDVRHSKTPMGLFNEYFRKQPDVIRSADPLMSVALLGKHPEFATGIGHNSCGEGSTFDLLHKTDLSVKFLFFGTRIGDCFTYMHYIEDYLKVPYRYPRPFTGQVTDSRGAASEETYHLCVRYSNVLPGPGSYIYENVMLERGIALQDSLGDSIVTVVGEAAAFAIYQDMVQSYPCFFISAPFKEEEKTTEFVLKSPMVAL